MKRTSQFLGSILAFFAIVFGCTNRFPSKPHKKIFQFWNNRQPGEGKTNLLLKFPKKIQDQLTQLKQDVLENINIQEKTQGVVIAEKPLPKPLPISPGDCGKQMKGYEPKFPKTRLIDGNSAEPHSWPWQLLYMHPDGPICGAVLVPVEGVKEKSNIVATATVCLGHYVRREDENKGEIVPRMHNRSEDFSPHYKVIDFLKYSTVAAHPNDDSDITILRLNDWIEFDNKAKPICLMEDGDLAADDTLCVITGWGRQTGESGAPYSEVLKQLVVTIRDNDFCDYTWGDLYVKDQMVCAGTQEGYAGPCSGDFGGPLQCLINGEWKLFGIATHVDASCTNSPEKPAIFASGAKIGPFIRDVGKFMSREVY